MPDTKGTTELEKLFEGLPEDEVAEGDVFSDITKKDGEAGDAAPATGDAPTVVTPAEGDEPHKNRRHRRLEQQLQREREARIAAEAREKALAERPAPAAGTDEVPDAWIRMYGDTPESRTAWALNKGIISDFMSKAEANAVKTIEERQAAAKRQEAEFQGFIEGELEAIEDEFNVDVTSDAPAAKKARRELLELVSSLSPKGEDGAITGYADFSETYKILQDRKKAAAPDKTRAKEVASRGMVKSGDAAGTTETKRTPGFFGWRQDLGNPAE